MEGMGWAGEKKQGVMLGTEAGKEGSVEKAEERKREMGEDRWGERGTGEAGRDSGTGEETSHLKVY